MSEIIAHLESVIRERQAHPSETSYTCRLLAAGQAEILKKVGEEASEVLVAAALEGSERLVYETADLVYHVLVMLHSQGLSWDEVEAELARRFK